MLHTCISAGVQPSNTSASPALKSAPANNLRATSIFFASFASSTA